MPAIGAFSAVLVAVLFLLAAIAIWLLGEVAARLLGHIPLVGGYIASEARALAGAVGTGLLDDFDYVAGEAGWLFASISAWAWQHLFNTSLAVGHAVGLAIEGIDGAAQALGEIPNVAREVEAYAAGEAANAFRGAVGVAEGLYNDAVAYAGRVAADAEVFAEQHADQLFNDAVGDINRLAGVVGADVSILSGEIANVERILAGDVSSLLSTIAGDLSIAVATAEQDALHAEQVAIAAAATLATEAAAGAVGALNLGAHDLVLGPWAALLPELGAIVEALPADVVQALGLEGLLHQPLSTTIPGILAMTIPAIAAIGVEVERCVIPQCANLGNLSNLFANLLQDALWLLLIALLAEAVHDPAAISRDVQDSLLGPAQAMLGGLRGLVGV